MVDQLISAQGVGGGSRDDGSSGDGSSGFGSSRHWLKSFCLQARRGGGGRELEIKRFK